MRQSIVRGNTIERPNRNNITTTYGMLFSTGSYQLTCEKNKIQKLYEGNPGQSTTTYGIMHTFASALGFESNIRNNLINVTKTNGFVAGLYCYGSYSNIFHNTVAIDDANSGGTNTTYGAYGYGTNTFYKNNNISITRGGGGSRWGLYYPSTMANGASNGNNVWLQNGTMYYGYYWANGNMATLANWQTVNGFDANSFNTDPLFMNAAILNYMPGSNVMNNGGQVLNVTDDILGASRSLATPDPGAYEYFNVPCAGTPTVNTTITPTTIVCPNSSIGAYLANSYTTSGHTFQWQVSNLSAVGPWTPITTGTTSALSTTIGSTVLWYSAVVTCTNGGSNITAAGASVNVAGTTINNVPYFEGFEGIGSNGKLPNCSWTASNLQNTCFTYTSSQATLRIPRTGNSFANFYYLPAQSNFFWSNGIQMEPGVTYSISTWYITDPNSYTNWNLNLMISPNQSTVGANVVATTGGAAVAPVYKSLSNTFTVATSGIYYIGVNGVSTGACCGNYLTWDDLEVIVPCSLNQPNMTVSSSSQTVCAGQSVVLTAVGADSFAWSNGATSNVITVNPQIPTMYSVVGTNTASSCSATINQMVNVFPTPQVTIFAPVTSICIGSSANLIGVGANTYTWSNASNSGNITVSPSSTTTYSLIGANSFGCSANTTQVITVNPLPSVGINSSNANGLACETDITTLTGSGAATYQWASNNGVVVGNPINVTPASTITYTVYGTSAQGCTNVSTYELTVTNCVGLASQNGVNTAIMLYPNPNNGTFTIDWNTNDSKSAEVMDVTGRVILSTTNSANHINMDMSNFANGVYYVKLYSDASTEVIKVVKQ